MENDKNYTGYVEVHTKSMGILKYYFRSAHLFERLYMNHIGISGSNISHMKEGVFYHIPVEDVIMVEKIFNPVDKNEYKYTYITNAYVN